MRLPPRLRRTSHCGFSGFDCVLFNSSFSGPGLVSGTKIFSFNGVIFSGFGFASTSDFVAMACEMGGVETVHLPSGLDSSAIKHCSSFPVTSLFLKMLSISLKEMWFF